MNSKTLLLFLLSLMLSSYCIRFDEPNIIKINSYFYNKEVYQITCNNSYKYSINGMYPSSIVLNLGATGIDSNIVLIDSDSSYSINFNLCINSIIVDSFNSNDTPDIFFMYSVEGDNENIEVVFVSCCDFKKINKSRIFVKTKDDVLIVNKNEILNVLKEQNIFNEERYYIATNSIFTLLCNVERRVILE